MALFKLDDGTEAVEAMVNEELLDANKALLVEDELLIATGKLQTDRFSGGLRLTVNNLCDLAGARARFGRRLEVDVVAGAPPVADVLRTWPARRVNSEAGELVQGLQIRLRVQRRDAYAEMDLGDEWRFWPCDEALARWRGIAHEGRSRVVYE